jgi:preprotein translocase subunit SecA
MLDETVEYVIGESCPDDELTDHWDFERMQMTINQLVLEPVSINSSFQKIKDIHKDIKPSLDELKMFMDSFKDNDEVMNSIPRVMLSFIDSTWIHHLDSMTRLKEGIGLRAYQQEDPMRIYQSEGLDLFAMNYQELRRSIANEIIGFMKIISTKQEEQ